MSEGLLDENGTPKVVYHGTDADFTIFERGDIGYHVGTYAQAKDRISGVSGGHVMPLYVKITNPLDIGMDYGDWHGKNVAEMLLETEQWEEDYDENAEVINARLAEIADMPDNENTDKVLRKYLQSLGYDGIAYINEFEDSDYSGNNETSYIVFEPTQIKSATDNIGTFDGRNRDIRFSKAAPADEAADMRDMRLADVLARTAKGPEGEAIRRAAEREKNDAVQAVKEQAKLDILFALTVWKILPRKAKLRKSSPSASMCRQGAFCFLNSHTGYAAIFSRKTDSLTEALEAASAVEIRPFFTS